MANYNMKIDDFLYNDPPQIVKFLTKSDFN